MHTIDELNHLFESQYNSATLHHAWIIEGIQYDDVVPWLNAVIAKLLESPLGENHFHPNVYWLNTTEAHSIDAIRKAIQFLEKTSWDGGWKVCVILGAEDLNPQAQNALLKIAEEAPQKSIIFLVSELARTLLPTLYSRALHITLSDHCNASASSSFEQFQEAWTQGILSVLHQKNYEPIFAVQTQLDEDNVPAKTQAKWIMLTLKRLVDTAAGISDDQSSLIPTLASTASYHEWLNRWEHAQKYITDAQFFDVDQKHFCVKLTTKILQQLRVTL